MEPAGDRREHSAPPSARHATLLAAMEPAVGRREHADAYVPDLTDCAAMGPAVD